jgi:sortase (surface protein transpeptidase)
MPVATPVVRPLEIPGAPPPPAAQDGAAPAPARLRIPGIGVDTALVKLGLQADGTIEVPPDPAVAGWYGDGPPPGAAGPAVILGHLDSVTGPAVFARLAEVRPGDEVRVARADGSELRFTVRRVATFPVASFPTEEVYGVTAEPALRLITCGGAFDYAQGRYRSNVVVFAGLTA